MRKSHDRHVSMQRFSDPESSSRRRLVGLSLYPAAQHDNGGKNRIYNLARGCSQTLDVTFLSQSYSLAALRSSNWTELSDSYREFVFLDPLSALSFATSRWLRIPELLHSAVYDIVVPKWMRQVVARADVVVVEQPWLFAWANKQRTAGQALVYDAHNVEADMFDLHKIRGPRKYARTLAARIRDVESFAVQHADLVLATSHDDAGTLAARYGVDSGNVEIVPNGVDCSYFLPATVAEKVTAKARLGLTGKRVVLFCGAKHPPNTEAVRAILAWAAEEGSSEVHFLIVGSVGRSFPGGDRENVTFTGFVDDVRPYFLAADVAVNPMVSGSGTNLKQVEYLASGLPSITTEFGARGIGLVDGRDVVLCDISQMSAANALLSANEDLALRIGDAARALAVKTFDWDPISSRLAVVYGDLMSRKTQARVA